MGSKATATRPTREAKAGRPQESAHEHATVPIPADLAGDALVRHVLLRAGVSVEAANEAKPADGMNAYFLTADRASSAYRKACRSFAAHVPGFDAPLADVGARLLQHAKDENALWEQVRVERQKGEGREASRKEAASLRAKVIALSRFAFRRSTKVMAELDRIAGGKRIANLVSDLDDLVALMRTHASTYAKLSKLKGVAERAAELAVILRTRPDRVRAAARLASRNRALFALGLSLKEIRAGAKVLHADDGPRALAPYRAASTSRSRRARAKAKAKTKAAPNGGRDAAEGRATAPLQTSPRGRKTPARRLLRSG